MVILSGCAGYRAGRAYARGNTCFDKGDWRCAITEYGAAVQLDPGERKYRFNLALALSRARLYDQAAEELRRILADTPGDVEASRLFTLVSARIQDRAQP